MITNTIIAVLCIVGFLAICGVLGVLYFALCTKEADGNEDWDN